MNRPAHRAGNRAVTIGTLAAAAVAILVVGVTLVAELPAGGDRYATRIGEQRKLMLADGSRVMLDTDTAMTVKFVDGARRVSLDHGQAFFTVAHDAARPFTVDAGGARVLAMGTQFDVHRNGGTVDVTLVEGSVRVSADGRPVARLRAGQALTLDGGRVAAHLSKRGASDSAVPEMKLVRMEHQWGSCTPTGTVHLNPALIRAPRHCIDYVLLHELCHLREHNHSKKFYALLQMHNPNWANTKAELDRLAEILLAR